MAINYIPKGFHSVTPYLFIKDAAAAIEFYTDVFTAEEITRLTMPDHRIAYAAMKIGDSNIMLADEFPEMNVYSPQSLKGTAVVVQLYVADADTCFNKAIEAGAKIQKPIEDQFFGDRSGSVIDPFGHIWNIVTHKEDLSEDEIQKRFQALWG